MSDTQRELRRAFIALGYFTRVPIPEWVGWSPDELNRAARYFPLVGVLVGAVGAISLLLGAALWTPMVAVSLSMLVTILLTGAFHEDGLADSADGFGGGFEPKRVLAIMQDSRIGTYGALALGLALLIKFCALLALAELNLGLAALALVIAHAGSRASALSVMVWLPYARIEGATKAKPVAEGISSTEWRIGCAIAGLPLLLAWVGSPLTLLQGVAVMLTLLAVAWLAAKYCRRRISGYTGDALGATQQVAEIATYLVLCAAWV
ncbi:adenosylcobinamide-GDP ribazoletransferase [Polycyclovorans algicola]|uniref:adenosylcobinamide-GDP ribazoletransferase n=1 Tax=Polycyclovorans algicola TaxID=616992 RepID=UPI0004A77CB9|nr:adenosylcobinamide-GDP ribazoletransferase [Polycyclovorans algicola]